MSDTNISDEGCRRCDRLEDQLESAEKQVKTLRAQLRESGELCDGLAAKIIELEGLGAERADKTSRIQEVVALCRALDEWKSAGADSLTVVDALLAFADQRVRCGIRDLRFVSSSDSERPR